MTKAELDALSDEGLLEALRRWLASDQVALQKHDQPDWLVRHAAEVAAEEE
jgi:hypothetical protein